jgi:hypothetical protein
VTDINCDVPTRVVTAAAWHARTGASGLLLATTGTAFPGTGLSGTGRGTGPVGLVPPVPHVRTKAVAASLAAVMAQDRQTNNYIQMTSVFVSSEGASGPPPDREPA